MLTEIADGVWVRQSEWVWSNTTLVRSDDGLVVVDPGISGAELDDLADGIDRIGVPVVAGLSTHPHWDHLLWHGRFGDVPRYASAPNAALAAQARDRARAMAEESTTGVPLDLVALVTALPDDAGLPGELLQHDAHAIGHLAVLLADRGVLLAGDMLSDLLIPMFDPRQQGQPETYAASLDRLEQLLPRVDVLVPGHGAVARGAEVAERLAADRAYVDAVRRGDDPDDPRLEQEWLAGPHQGNLDAARASR